MDSLNIDNLKNVDEYVNEKQKILNKMFTKKQKVKLDYEKSKRKKN